MKEVSRKSSNSHFNSLAPGCEFLALVRSFERIAAVVHMHLIS